jgi:opacity protein-like surface antigen
MVKNRIITAAMAALLSGAASIASAADIIEPPIVELPEIPVVEHVKAGGWYIRGDVGYSMNAIDDIHYDVFTPPAGPFSTGLLRGKMSENFSFGGGIGYDTGHLLRADLTIDYFTKSNFTGNSFCGVPSAACTDDTTSRSDLVALANAYVNLGTYNRITPYVGAGIGGTQVNWSTLNNVCRPGVPGCVTDTHGGASGWRFTYAVMAGASYDINDCFAVDAGYRYRRMEGGKMFGIASLGNPGSGYDKGSTAHDFRIGARYKFGGGHGCGGGHAPAPELVEYKPIFK